MSTTAWAQPGPPAWTAPAEPSVRPALPSRGEFDLDNNRVDDRIDHGIGALRRELAREKGLARREELAARLAAPVPIEVVFTEQVTQQQIDAFLALGGSIGHLYQAVSYGWSGTLPGVAVDALPAAMGPALLVVAADTPAQLHMDEATREGRVRPVWASGFAGTPNGLSGTSDITVGLVDTGIDDSHTDLAGRMEYWHDYTTDGEANPRDIVQHGSHVAGIAVGTGAAFGVGPGTLKYTDSGDLTGVAANQFFLNGVHFPTQLMTIQMNAAWLGGGSTLLRVAARTNGVGGGFISICNSATVASPISLTCQTNGNATQIYSTALPQNSATSLQLYGTTVSLSPYQPVGDGFNAMRGVAPGAKWAAAKVFTNAGTGSASTIAAGVDGLVAERSAHNIKVMNLSLGINGSPGVDASLRAKVNTAVNNGIVVVASAGNDGPGVAGANYVDDPGRAALVLTVGATNDANALTRYTSSGFPTPGTDEDNKPDLLAPGGSDYYSKILSVDSNDSDADDAGYADRQANDYANLKGTSMSSPFAAGAAALMVDALQKNGSTWNFNSGAQPLFVKMMLCASSTETNANREATAGTNPILGRAAAPKDLFEGYGIMNPDAAVEAISTVYSGGTIGGTSAGGTFDRRAWGRKLGITSGGAVSITLTVPSTADYDLYLYSGNPDAKGNPVLRASSTNAGNDLDETIVFTPTSTETRYLFVKRVSGSGDWSLTNGTATGACGDGQKTGQEQCDDGNQANGDCCSSSCTYEANGSPCDDGLFCTSTDTCNSTGTCSGTGNPCSTGGECSNSCSEANNNCFTTGGTTCTSDSNPCTLDQCNGSGSCAHPAGNAGTVCRAASGVCDVAETCTGSAVLCPVDGYAGTTTTCRVSGGVCDPAEVCQGTGTSCPANTFSSSTTTCRTSGGICDPAETCTGASATCPANTFSSSTTPCRSSASVCDAAETCTGAAAACPTDVFAPTTTVCRSASGICDAAESCTGTNGSCPADALAQTTKVCRAASATCDAAETCSGSSTACPANEFAPSTKVCRDAASVCDVAETCPGDDDKCPSDGVADAGAVCRPAGGVCDTEETCNGRSGACPADDFEPTTTVCRTATGVCDAAERCSGTTATCPANGFAPSTTTCRDAGGVCDSAEHCTGAGASCPADTLAGTSTVCRPAAGGCDAPEFCTGILPLCPIDLYELAATPCRASAGVCDAVESCSGLSPDCPADEFASGNTCRSSTGVCDPAEACSGTSASCPANNFASSTTPCRAASGVCDVAETCTGSSGACAADGVASDSTTCRTSAGDCDVAETCDGNGKACPANDFAPAETTCTSDGLPCTEDVCTGSSATCQHVAGNAGATCRSAGGVCDPAETCNGTSTTCPSNSFAPSSLTCRTASGVCDVAETCTGNSASCPSDAVASAAVTCRTASGVCDEAEACDGAAKSCPADGFASPSVTCRASAGVCDVAETCSGSAKTCPSNSLAADNTTCTNDSNVCTNDVCNGVSAECQHEANSAPCNDGQFCNGTDTCAATTCSVHAGDPCVGADGDADCTESCSEATDTCSAADPDDSPCNDGLSCTSGDSCQAGTCTAATSTCSECGDGHVDDGEECDDGNVANGDCCSSACKIAGGNGACDDGEFCNGNDHCLAGACSQHDGDPCPGADGDADCTETCDEAADACSASDGEQAPCNDGQFCNGEDACSAGACDQHSGNPCTGADGDGNCAESCSENNDNCTAADPNGSPCNDAAFCNGADTCSGGTCSGHAGDPCPGADGDANCAESCNEPSDSCGAADPGGSDCNDDDPCTVNDACTAGTCGGAPSGAPECTTTTTLSAQMCGDATDDGKITASDAQFSLRSAVGSTDCGLEVCDYNGDAKVTATDALFILRAAVGQDVQPHCPESAAALAVTSTVPEGTTTTTIEDAR